MGRRSCSCRSRWGGTGQCSFCVCGVAGWWKTSLSCLRTRVCWEMPSGGCRPALTAHDVALHGSWKHHLLLRQADTLLYTHRRTSRARHPSAACTSASRATAPSVLREAANRNSCNKKSAKPLVRACLRAFSVYARSVPLQARLRIRRPKHAGLSIPPRQHPVLL